MSLTYNSLRDNPDDFRYTMLIGKPPFQTKDVKAIYKRIKENRYEFPVEKEISASAKDLIMTILNQNPGRSVSHLYSQANADKTSRTAQL